MRWPWVSRGLYEEACKTAEEFRKSNAECYERLLASTAELAVANSKLESLATMAEEEPTEREPVRGKIRLDQIRTMASDSKRKEFELKNLGKTGT